MKIDNLINEVKTTTEDLIIITNKSTISSFFEDINKEVSISGSFGVFNNTKNTNKAQSIFRGGVTIHFIDQEDIDENVFASSITNAI